MRKAIVSAVLFCFVSLVNPAYGQSTGTIQGSVLDTTGAGIPNASVKVRNEQTGEERSTLTAPTGLYAVPSLAVGTYRVEVRAPGLQTAVASKIDVSVGSQMKVDFTMKVASTSEVVEVTAAAPAIESSTVTVGSVVNQRTVQEIPLNGRHFVDLGVADPRFGRPLRRTGSSPLRCVARARSSFNIGGQPRGHCQLHDQRHQPERSEPEPDHVPADDQHGLRVQGRQLDLQRRVRPQLRARSSTSLPAPAPTTGTARPSNSCAITTSTRGIFPIRPMSSPAAC